MIVIQYLRLEHSQLFTAADTQLQLALAQMDTRPTTRAVSREGLFGELHAEITVEMPASMSPEGFLEALRSALTHSQLQLLSIDEITGEADSGYALQLGLGKSVTHRLFVRVPKVRIALLFDDFGYCNDASLLQAFFTGIDVPFSIAIIPGTTYGTEIAELAYKNDKEILVHMPMEPQGEYANDYEWLVCQDMSGEEIRRSVREAIASVPHAKGLNNHMGSLVTTREELMTPVLKAVQERGLYFVDSRTTSSSIAYTRARELNVRATYNCVFLDNKKEAAYIENQFEQLVSLALEQGWALGLGHCHPVTASAVSNAIRSHNTAKIRYVNISEIVE